MLACASWDLFSWDAQLVRCEISQLAQTEINSRTLRNPQSTLANLHRSKGAYENRSENSFLLLHPRLSLISLTTYYRDDLQNKMFSIRERMVKEQQEYEEQLLEMGKLIEQEELKRAEIERTVSIFLLFQIACVLNTIPKQDLLWYFSA